MDQPGAFENNSNWICVFLGVFDSWVLGSFIETGILGCSYIK